LLRIIGGASIAINKKEIKQNGDQKTGCTTITTIGYKWEWDTKKARVWLRKGQGVIKVKAGIAPCQKVVARSLVVISSLQYATLSVV
jgi:hypothetical protein